MTAEEVRGFERNRKNGNDREGAGRRIWGKWSGGAAVEWRQKIHGGVGGGVGHVISGWRWGRSDKCLGMFIYHTITDLADVGELQKRLFRCKSGCEFVYVAAIGSSGSLCFCENFGYVFFFFFCNREKKVLSNSSSLTKWNGSSSWSQRWETDCRAARPQNWLLLSLVSKITHQSSYQN